MRITRRQLRRIIREAHGGALGEFPGRYDTGIPIADLEWQPDEKGHMNVDDADGNDWWEVLDSEDDLPVWKAKVAAHGDGSTVVFSKGLNRWKPRSGPWADAARKYRQAKSAFLSKPLFELRKVTRNQLRRIIREELQIVLEAVDTDGDGRSDKQELEDIAAGMEGEEESGEDPGVDLRGIKVTPQSIARLKSKMRRTSGHISGPRTKDVPVGMWDPRTGRVRTK